MLRYRSTARKIDYKTLPRTQFIYLKICDIILIIKLRSPLTRTHYNLKSSKSPFDPLDPPNSFSTNVSVDNTSPLLQQQLFLGLRREQHVATSAVKLNLRHTTQLVKNSDPDKLHKMAYILIRIRF